MSITNPAPNLYLLIDLKNERYNFTDRISTLSKKDYWVLLSAPCADKFRSTECSEIYRKLLDKYPRFVDIYKYRDELRRITKVHKSNSRQKALEYIEIGEANLKLLSAMDLESNVNIDFWIDYCHKTDFISIYDLILKFTRAKNKITPAAKKTIHELTLNKSEISHFARELDLDRGVIPFQKRLERFDGIKSQFCLTELTRIMLKVYNNHYSRKIANINNKKLNQFIDKYPGLVKRNALIAHNKFLNSKNDLGSNNKKQMPKSFKEIALNKRFGSELSNIDYLAIDWDLEYDEIVKDVENALYKGDQTNEDNYFNQIEYEDRINNELKGYKERYKNVDML